jgi:hypothetical protein
MTTFLILLNHSTALLVPLLGYYYPVREEMISQLSRLGFLSSLCRIYVRAWKRKSTIDLKRGRKEKTRSTTNGFSHIPVMMRLHEINSSRTLFQLLGFFNQYIRRIIEKSKEKSKSVGGYIVKVGKTKKERKQTLTAGNIIIIIIGFSFSLMDTLPRNLWPT